MILNDLEIFAWILWLLTKRKEIANKVINSRPKLQEERNLNIKAKFQMKIIKENDVIGK
jgi:hypothetical protein